MKIIISSFLILICTLVEGQTKTAPIIYSDSSSIDTITYDQTEFVSMQKQMLKIDSILTAKNLKGQLTKQEQDALLNITIIQYDHRHETFTEFEIQSSIASYRMQKESEKTLLRFNELNQEMETLFEESNSKSDSLMKAINLKLDQYKIETSDSTKKH